MDDTVYFVNGFGMSCGMGALKTSSLVNGHIYQYSTLFISFSIGRVMRWGAFAPGIRTAPIIKSVVGSSFSILWLDENNVFTFLGMNSLN